MSETPRSLDDLVAEGTRLLRERPFCRKSVDDYNAATLIRDLHHMGFSVSTDTAAQCIRRVRIAVDTGIYPDELLLKTADDHANVIGTTSQSWPPAKSVTPTTGKHLDFQTG